MNGTPESPPVEAIPGVTGETPLPAFVSTVEAAIRRHPIAAILTVVGVGCAVGVMTRELLTPAPAPKNRALRLLEDIQSRLAELAEPARDRVSQLTEDGVNAVKHGYDSVVGSTLGDRLRHWFT